MRTNLKNITQRLLAPDTGGGAGGAGGAGSQGSGGSSGASGASPGTQQGASGNTGAAQPPTTGANPPAASNQWQPPAWSAGASAKGIGLLSSKKYETPAHVLDALANSQEFVGAPADEMMRFPKDGLDDAGRAKLDKFLKVPETPDGYKNLAPATDTDKPQMDWFKQTAHKLKMGEDQANGLAKAWDERMDALRAEVQAEAKAEQSDALNRLRVEWGNDTQRRIDVSKNVLAQLGWTKEEIEHIRDAKGEAGLAKFVWDKIVTKIGEGKLVTPTGGSTDSRMDPKGAEYRKQELMKDDGFKLRHRTGTLTRVEKAEWEEIHKAIAAGKEAAAGGAFSGN